jgi:hypothetical protein
MNADTEGESSGEKRALTQYQRSSARIVFDIGRDLTGRSHEHAATLARLHPVQALKKQKATYLGGLLSLN